LRISKSSRFVPKNDDAVVAGSWLFPFKALFFFTEASGPALLAYLLSSSSTSAAEECGGICARLIEQWSLVAAGCGNG
jgi:hypothetical protein